MLRRVKAAIFTVVIGSLLLTVVSIQGRCQYGNLNQYPQKGPMQVIQSGVCGGRGCALVNCYINSVSIECRDKGLHSVSLINKKTGLEIGSGQMGGDPWSWEPQYEVLEAGEDPRRVIVFDRENRLFYVFFDQWLVDFYFQTGAP